MIRLGKLIVILAAFRFFVFDLITPSIDLTNSAQVTAIICVSLVALMLSIVFVLKR